MFLTTLSAEKVVFLPHSYHIFDHKQTYEIKPPPPRTPGSILQIEDSISQENFPKKNFCSAIILIISDCTPNYFTTCNDFLVRKFLKLFRANIVKRTAPNSTLVMKYYNEQSANNMRHNARQEGLIVSDDPEESQLLFMPGIGGNEHIHAKSICNLYLDVRNLLSFSGNFWIEFPPTIMTTFLCETSFTY